MVRLVPTPDLYQRRKTYPVGGPGVRVIPENYGFLPGIAGNYFSTPDAAKYNPSSLISVRVYVAAVDWTPSAIKTLAAKYWAQFSWKWSLMPTGFLRLEWSTAGAGFDKTLTQDANAAGFSDGVGGWLRVDLNLSNGNVDFYKSTDTASTLPASVNWSLMQTKAGSGPTTVNDSNDHIEFCGDQKSGGTTQLACNIFRGQIYINGSIAGNFNPGETQTGATTWTSSTGEVWTVFQSGGNTAKIISKDQNRDAGQTRVVGFVDSFRVTSDGNFRGTDDGEIRAAIAA